MFQINIQSNIYHPSWGCGCLGTACVLHLCPLFPIECQTNTVRKHDGAGTAVSQTNHCLYKATERILVCKPILTDFKTWKRSLLIVLRAAQKMRERKTTHSTKSLTPNCNRETNILKGMVIKPWDPILQKTQRGWELLHYHTTHASPH